MRETFGKKNYITKNKVGKVRNMFKARVDTFLFMVGYITGKMFDHPIEKDCVSDLSDPGSCRIGPVREVAGPENAAIQNLAALHC